jgi:hypothetical protein
MSHIDFQLGTWNLLIHQNEHSTRKAGGIRKPPIIGTLPQLYAGQIFKSGIEIRVLFFLTQTKEFAK